MNAKKSSLCGVPFITIHGDIDHASVRELAPLMLDCLAPRGGRLVFDLTDCPYLDSSGIGLFLGLLFDVAETDWIGVVGANKPMSRVFDLTGLSSQRNVHVWADMDGLRRDIPLLSEPSSARSRRRVRPLHAGLAFS